MIKKIVFSLLLTFIINQAHCQKHFPTYSEITSEFFNNYKLRENQNYNTIRFVKQPDGYYVEEYSQVKKTFENKQLLWSLKKGKYLKIEFPKSKSADLETLNKILANWNADKYDLYPYYGYINWEKDVIAELESRKTLSDDDIYALGRAYSNSATNLLNNNTGFADTAKIFNLSEFGDNLFSFDELMEYRYYRHKAISTFKILCDKNPTYKTIVGSIRNKYHNEYLTSFLDLRIYHNEFEALKELPDSIYSSLYLDMARNYLASCDSNAILFTNGDNDTYPLLYLQAKESYRDDVVIINLNLLNNNNYTNHLRIRGFSHNNSLKMILSPESYSGNKQAYTSLRKNASINGHISLSEALNLINNQDPLSENDVYPDYRYLVSDKLRININKKHYIDFEISRNYITKGELLALDIIQSNISDRSIYFLYNRDLGLINYFELSGFAYKLVDSENPTEHFQLFGGIDAKKTYNQLINNFYFSRITESDIPTVQTIIYPYQRSFCHLAKHYSDIQDADSCLTVIEHYMKLFPNEVYKMDYSLLPMVHAAYKVELIDKGDSIAKSIIENIETQISSKNLSDKDISYINYTAKQLYKLIENNDLKNRLDDIFEAI